MAKKGIKIKKVSWWGLGLFAHATKSLSRKKCMTLYFDIHADQGSASNRKGNYGGLIGAGFSVRYSMYVLLSITKLEGATVANRARELARPRSSRYEGKFEFVQPRNWAVLIQCLLYLRPSPEAEQVERGKCRLLVCAVHTISLSPPVTSTSRENF